MWKKNRNVEVLFITKCYIMISPEIFAKIRIWVIRVREIRHRRSHWIHKIFAIVGIHIFTVSRFWKTYRHSFVLIVAHGTDEKIRWMLKNEANFIMDCRFHFWQNEEKINGAKDFCNDSKQNKDVNANETYEVHIWISCKWASKCYISGDRKIGAIDSFNSNIEYNMACVWSIHILNTFKHVIPCLVKQQKQTNR